MNGKRCNLEKLRFWFGIIQMYYSSIDEACFLRHVSNLLFSSVCKIVSKLINSKRVSKTVTLNANL